MMLLNKLGGCMEAKRSTIYFDPEIHKALQMKSIETAHSISELVNEAVRLTLAQDIEDIKAFRERRKEPLVSFEDVLKKLKKDGKI